MVIWQKVPDMQLQCKCWCAFKDHTPTPCRGCLWHCRRACTSIRTDPPGNPAPAVQAPVQQVQNQAGSVLGSVLEGLAGRYLGPHHQFVHECLMLYVLSPSRPERTESCTGAVEVGLRSNMFHQIHASGKLRGMTLQVLTCDPQSNRSAQSNCSAHRPHALRKPFKGAGVCRHGADTEGYCKCMGLVAHRAPPFLLLARCL